MARHVDWESYDAARRLGKTSAAYRRNREITLRPDPLWCQLCGQRIEKHLRWPHPRSKTCDHRIPITDGGDPVALGNLQPAHLDCNLTKERERRAALDGRTARPLGATLAPRVSLSDTDSWLIEEDP